MKTKPKYLTAKTGLLAVLLLVAATCGVFLLKHGTGDASQKPAPKTLAKTPSYFSFSGADGWWQGATNQTSMAVFHDAHDCFVSAERKVGTVDAAAELQKQNGSLTDSGYTVTSEGTQTLAVQTQTGPKQYELHQYSVTTPGGATVLEGGQEFGYVQLPDSYIKIMGYCDTSAELASTTAALQAITYSAEK